jgi:hypothetical protein
MCSEWIFSRGLIRLEKGAIFRFIIVKDNCVVANVDNPYWGVWKIMDAAKEDRVPNADTKFL